MDAKPVVWGCLSICADLSRDHFFRLVWRIRTFASRRDFGLGAGLFDNERSVRERPSILGLATVCDYELRYRTRRWWNGQGAGTDCAANGAAPTAASGADGGGPAEGC